MDLELVKTFQGASEHTKRKEQEIGGLTKMRFNQFKSPYFRYNNIYIADVFSGTGRNVINDELIDGSPIKLIEGVMGANNRNVDINFFFSDVRRDACEQLHRYIAERFKISIATNAMFASDAINMLGAILKSRPDIFLYLVLDPNGPKDFPKNEVHDLLCEFSKRIDVIPNISATTINRCLGARNKAGRQMQGWLANIDNFDEGFVSSLTMHGRSGWIRRPIKGDRFRWVMVPTFGCFKPKNNWEKHDYIDLKSEEGKNTVKFYCGA